MVCNTRAKDVQAVCRDSQSQADNEVEFYESSLQRMEWLVGVLRKSGGSPPGYQSKANTAMLQEIAVTASSLLRVEGKRS